MKTISSISM